MINPTISDNAILSCILHSSFKIHQNLPPFTTAARETLENEFQSHPRPPPPPPPPAAEIAAQQVDSFKPGIAIIVGATSTIFSIVFLLLLYLKHCTRIVYVSHPNPNGAAPLSRGNSGMNPKIIETLPMFLFSSLRGQKEGLECAVCLTRFDPEDILRLLPKCRHAFHVDCVDTWLDKHSTCPLCRYRVDPEDIGKVDNTKRKEIVGTRIISKRHSSVGNALEIVVEDSGRDLEKGKSRASFDGWRSRRLRKSENQSAAAGMKSKSTNSWSAFLRKGNSGRKDGDLPVQLDKHRLDHRIIISMGGEAEEEEKRRWSTAQAEDNLYLRLEMIMGDEDGRGVINDRSVSEVTGMNRYRSNKGKEVEEGVEKKSMDWLPQSQHRGKAAINSTAASSSSSSAV